MYIVQRWANLEEGRLILVSLLIIWFKKKGFELFYQY